MNFFEQQDQSRSRSTRLVALFVLGVAAIIAAVYAAAIVIMGTSGPGAAGIAWFNPELFAWVALVCLTVILSGSLIKWVALRQGGPAVAESLGGRAVCPASTDPRERVLVNVVEEMALAAGMPVPAMYILDQESGINAFAAGYSIDDAVVAVTRGCLEQLSRDELQGVVAHEFSHILNGDMRLNIRLIALISGILVLAVIGRIMLGSGRSSTRSKNSGPVVMMGLALFIIGYIGVFVSRIIQSAVSRQREFLADAAAVQFTRNPPGIAGALKKIGGFAAGSTVASPMAAETGHLFFGKAFNSIFSTHPPIAERIRRISGRYSGPAHDGVPVSRHSGGPVSGAAHAGAVGMAAPMAGAAFVNSAGTLPPAAIARSAGMLDAMPAWVRDEVHDPYGACCIVYALLLDRNPVEKNKQMQALAAAVPAEVLRRVERLYGQATALEPDMVLSLLDLSIPALRHLSPRQYADCKQHVRLLVEADGTITLFEFLVQQILLHRMAAVFNRRGTREIYRSIEPLLEDAAVIISRLAAEGHSDPVPARAAFAAALRHIPLSTAHELQVRTASLEQVGAALEKFAASRPAVKRMLLEACAQCVLHDQQITPAEAGLIRAIAYALDVPVPLPASPTRQAGSLHQ